MIRKALLAFGVVTFMAGSALCQEITNVKIKKALSDITWYNTSAFKIVAANKTIFIDINTNRIEGKADIILFTHGHEDHFQAMTIGDILKDSTVIIAPPMCLNNKTLKEYNKKTLSLLPGDSIAIDGVTIKAVYAYNIQKKYHVRGENFVGYMITADGVTYYHTGDTERIPEMKNYTCDIIMLPLGQKYTMNSVEEAADVVFDVKASVAIPMHWGAHEGTADDVKKFQKLLAAKKISCVVKEAE